MFKKYNKSNIYENCNKFQKSDTRIKLIHTDNKGASTARNLGIELSTGKFITFIDADDYISKEYIKKLYNLCIENDSQISIIGVTDCYSESDDYKKSGKNFKKTLKNTQALCEILNEKYCFAAVWGKMYSRKLWTNIRFNVNTKIGEDLEVLYKVFQFANRVTIDTSSRLYFYTKYREESITKNGNDDDWNAEILICENIIKECKEKYREILPYAIKRYIRVNYTCMVNALKEKDFSKYMKFKTDILNYCKYSIYRKFGIIMKIKLFLALHFGKIYIELEK